MCVKHWDIHIPNFCCSPHPSATAKGLTTSQNAGLCNTVVTAGAKTGSQTHTPQGVEQTKVPSHTWVACVRVRQGSGYLQKPLLFKKGIVGSGVNKYILN